jgi:Ran GTPase-activating protein (RanGAP) involved in mRNA processing and transport
MSQKTIEEHWGRLECALTGTNSRSQSHRVSSRSINSQRHSSTRTLPQTKAKSLPLSEPQLKSLYAAKCQDIGLPVLPEQENRFFSLCANSFKDRKFVMKESGLGQHSAAAIGKVLRTTAFAYVELGRNSIGNEGAVLLVREIKNSQTIAHLDLSNNEIGPEGFENIARILARHPSIVSVDLSSYEGLRRNRAGVAGAAAFSQVLKMNPIVQFVSLAGTSLFEGFEHISRGLEGNRNILSMNLSNNALTGRQMLCFSKSLITTELQDLNLSHNKIGDEGCEFLANMMLGAYEAACPLVSFNLSNNSISTKGALKLFHALRLNCFIKHFNVSGNCFTGGLSQYFSSFLADNCAVLTLDLSNSQLKPEAFVDIAEGLAKNAVLEDWDLSGNRLEDLGIEALATGLGSNIKLKRIFLTNCQIRTQGAIALAKGLKGNDSLETLVLNDNSIKDDAGDVLVEMVRQNKSLLKVNLDMNPINLKYIDRMQDVLKENKVNWKKKVVPRILDEIDKIRGPLSSQEKKNEKIRKKLVRKKEYEKRYDFNEDIEDVKEREEKRTKMMIAQSRALREKNTDLSVKLDNTQNEIIVIYK